MRANSQLELGNRVNYQSTKDLNSSYDITSLNNSTSIGRVLYTKEERMGSKVKLPSIHKKNFKQLHNNVKLLNASDSVQKLIPQTSATSIGTTDRDTLQ